MPGMWGGSFMGMGGWIFLLIAAGFAYWAFSTGFYPKSRRYEGPLDIARGRLARGEITAEEYEDLRDRLLE